MAQLLITLGNGDQLIVRTDQDIKATNTSVKFREGPADCWTANLPTGRPHVETGVHFGSY